MDGYGLDKTFGNGAKLLVGVGIGAGVGLAVGIVAAPGIITAVALGAVGFAAGGAAGFIGTSLAIDGFENMEKFKGKIKGRFKRRLAQAKSLFAGFKGKVAAFEQKQEAFKASAGTTPNAPKSESSVTGKTATADFTANAEPAAETSETSVAMQQAVKKVAEKKPGQ